MRNIQKFLSLWCLTILVSLLSGSQAQAIYLLPGSLFPAGSEVNPVGGTVQDEDTVAFSSSVLAGTLTSRVISGDTSSSLGGLTFTYQFTLGAGSVHSANQLTASSFAGFQTDVSFMSLLGEVTPTFFERTSGAGSAVRFYFLGNNVMPGQTSALLVVQTDAVSWAPTTVAIIDGEAVNVASFAPAPVPEPSSLALLVSGLTAMAFLKRRKA